MHKSYLIILLFLIFISSCITKRKIVYFQDHNTKLIPHNKKEYKIQAQDVLSIKILSLDDVSSQFYNINNGNVYSPAALFYTGYSVSDSGYVQLPMLDSIKVTGFTLDEAKNKIQVKINQQLVRATVLVKLVFKFSVLGEVKNPGMHYVNNEQVSVLEALALAGDLTDVANRRRIKLVRPSESGTTMYIFDVTDSRIIESEFYYLQVNDIVYVEPLRAKFFRQNLGNVQFFISILTATLVLINILKKK
jgi:polysaccharide biosynthesis/export protein